MSQIENNSKQKKCAAALIFLTVISRKEELTYIAKEIGKLTLNYLNDTNMCILTFLEPELAVLFELFILHIKNVSLQKDFNCLNSSDYGLLKEINDAIQRAQQIPRPEFSHDLYCFRKDIQNMIYMLSI